MRAVRAMSTWPIPERLGVIAVIIALALLFGDGVGAKGNPASTSYDPRPEWYFFFLFELLRVIKPPSLTPLATIGLPTLAMILPVSGAVL